MIKTIKFFALFSLVALMTACNSDDEMTTTAGTLEGTWSAISFSADITTSTTVAGTSTSVVSAAVGSNFNYDLTLGGTDFTTSGSYDVETTATVNGTAFPASSSSYTNVSGSGTYTSTDNTITVSGSFYDFEVDGMNLDALGEEQTVNYEITADDQLIITQNEIIETTAGGVTASTTLVSSSTWERQ